MTSASHYIKDAALEAHARTGVQARFYEKDYHVTRILRQVFADLPERVVFKGGTSLSKAYQLIDRFSEDIDLLVVPEPKDDSKEAIERILDQITTSAQLGMPGAHARESDGEYGLARNVRLSPHYGTQGDGGISKRVLVESGRRGGPAPTEVRTIRPALAGVIAELEGDDFGEFEVTVLHPARTLVEKLFAVAQIGDRLAADPEYRLSNREPRHFYDIYMLLDEERSPALSYLDSSGELTTIVRSSEGITAKWFPPGGTPIHGSLADSPAFIDPSVSDRIAKPFVETCDLLCAPAAARPSWDQVLQRVAEHRLRLVVE